MILKDGTAELEQAISELGEFKAFLMMAPTLFGPDDLVHKYCLPTGEFVSCIRWNGIFYISGVDIVRSITYWFQAFGRKLVCRKKFEEGVFSDLRSMRIGVDSLLEPSKSPLLTLMHQNGCIRTKKKQKVFFWYAVRYDLLFMDALEREMRKERSCLAGENEKPTTLAVRAPADSFDQELASHFSMRAKTLPLNTQDPVPMLSSRMCSFVPPPVSPPPPSPPMVGARERGCSEVSAPEPKNLPCLLDAGDESDVDADDVDDPSLVTETPTPSSPKLSENNPLESHIPSVWRRNHRPNEFPESNSYY